MAESHNTTTASAQSGAMPGAPPDIASPEIAGREPLLAVADMLEEINALIDAKHYDAAEAKLAEAKAMLATVKIDGGAQ
jgi:hypothetical protein